MAEFDSKGRPLISVIRVLEYHGPAEWVQAVLGSSRLPLMGKVTSSPPNAKGEVFAFPEKCFILSGQVNWSEREGDEGREDTVPPAPIPIPPSGRPS